MIRLLVAATWLFATTGCMLTQGFRRYHESIGLAPNEIRIAEAQSPLVFTGRVNRDGLDYLRLAQAGKGCRDGFGMEVLIPVASGNLKFHEGTEIEAPSGQRMAVDFRVRAAPEQVPERTVVFSYDDHFLCAKANTPVGSASGCVRDGPFTPIAWRCRSKIVFFALHGVYFVTIPADMVTFPFQFVYGLTHFKM